MARPDRRAISVDEKDFVRVDGITIGKRVTGPDGKPRLQVCDKDRRRSAQRGTRFVEISVDDLGEVLADADNAENIELLDQEDS